MCIQCTLFNSQEKWFHCFKKMRIKYLLDYAVLIKEYIGWQFEKRGDKSWLTWGFEGLHFRPQLKNLSFL